MTPVAHPVVYSTLALKGTLETLVPDLRVHIHATKALMEVIERREPADLLILTNEAIRNLEKKGEVRDAVPLGSSGVAVAVRKGFPRPEIATVEQFKKTLMEAGSVARSKVGASGLYFGELVERLGIAGRLKKVVVVEKGPVGAAVARGEAEIGIQQLCELMPVPGIDIVGPFPDEVQVVTAFSAAIPVWAKNAAAGSALIDLLRSDAGRSAMRKNGMTPA